jgi:hypothetical protein
MKFHEIITQTILNMFPVVSPVVVEEVPLVDPGLAPVKAGLVLVVTR